MAETYVVTLEVKDKELIENLSFGGEEYKASNIATWISMRVLEADVTAWKSVEDFLLDVEEGRVK